MDNQEVTGKAQGFNQVKLVVELRIGTSDPFPVARAVPARGSVLGECPKPDRLALPRSQRKVRQPGCDQRQIESEFRAELGRLSHRSGKSRETYRHLRRRPQVSPSRGRQPAVQVIKAAPGPHSRQRRRQPGSGRGCVMHVVRGDEPAPVRRGDARERVVAVAVMRIILIPQFDGYVVPAEQRRQRVQRTPSRLRAGRDQRAGDTALAASGEHLPVPACPGRESLELDGQPAFPAPGQMRVRYRPAQPPVPLGTTRQDEQMLPRRVRGTVARRSRPKGYLGTEQGRQTRRGCRLGEANHSVHPVVIGDGKPGKPEPHRLRDQILRLTGAIEEAERRMTVQLRVGGPAG